MLDLFNARGVRGAALLGLLLAFAVLAATGDDARDLLEYRRDGLAQGQWWRLVSAHWVHLDWTHAMVNGAGLLLVWGLVIDELPARRWIVIAAGSAIAVSGGLWFGYPQIQWYVGASGVLHGLLAAGLISGWLRGDRVARLALWLLAAKLVYEAFAGPIGLREGQPVVTAAHGLGALGGIAGSGLGDALFGRSKKKPRVGGARTPSS